MGIKSKIILVNKTDYNWINTYHHDYQMNKWEFPDVIKAQSVESIEIEWSQGIFDTVTDDGGQVEYLLEGTNESFQVQASVTRLEDAELKIFFKDMKTHTQERGSELPLGYRLSINNYVAFILSGSEGNLSSTYTRDNYGRFSPSYTEEEINNAIMNFLRLGVMSGLKFIPQAGSFVSGLVGMLWKDKGKEDNNWDTIRQRVEVLIDKKISENNLEQLNLMLRGIRNVVNDYLACSANPTTAKHYISEKFNNAIAQLEVSEPYFKEHNEDPILFLPLFAQYANIYLGLLRDGVKFGRDWDWDESNVNDTFRKLQLKIEEYTMYAEEQYQRGLNNINPGDLNKCITYRREMILNVLDFKYYWQFFDRNLNEADQFIIPKLNREIFTNFKGWFSGELPEQNYGHVENTHERISKMEIFGSSMVNGYKVWCGSELVTDALSSRSATQIWGGNVLKENPITMVHTEFDDCIVQTTLTFKNGDTVSIGGNGTNRTRYFRLNDSFEGHILSNIYILHVNNDSVGCIVYGFRLEDSY